MQFTPKWRFSLVGILLLAQVGLVVWYGGLPPSPHVGDYPDPDDFVGDYDRYLHSNVTVGGKILDPGDPIVIRSRYGVGRSVQFRITDVSSSVTRGDELRVFGRAEPGYRIAATNVVTVGRGGFWYAYSISLLAGVWVLSRLIRHWRVDWTTPGLVPRDRPLAWREFLGAVTNLSGGS